MLYQDPPRPPWTLPGTWSEPPATSFRPSWEGQELPARSLTTPHELPNRRQGGPKPGPRVPHRGGPAVFFPPTKTKVRIAHHEDPYPTRERSRGSQPASHPGPTPTHIQRDPYPGRNLTPGRPGGPHPGLHQVSNRSQPGLKEARRSQPGRHQARRSPRPDHEEVPTGAQPGSAGPPPGGTRGLFPTHENKCVTSS